MTIHTGNPPWLSTKGPHIPVNMIRHTESQHNPGRTVSHTGGSPFSQRDPIFLGKWGPRVQYNNYACGENMILSLTTFTFAPLQHVN